MNKRTRIILILSVLLCLTLLFVSCDSGDGKTESPTEEPVQTPAPDQGENISAAIGEWDKYISFNAPEDVPAAAIDYLFSEIGNNGENITVNTHGIHSLVLTLRTREDVRGDTYYSRDYKVFNLETGKQVYSVSVPEYSLVSDISYEISFINDDGNYSGLFTVVCRTRENKGTEEFPEWEYIYSYSYYDANGKAIIENSEERLCTDVQSAGAAVLVTIGEDVYGCVDSEIIYTCDKGNERTIPHIDLDYKGYKYILSDFGVQSFNSDYELLSDYYADSIYDDRLVCVLSSGDIFVQLQNLLPDDSKKFDYETVDGDKYSIKQLIVSAASGDITELQPKFMVESMISGADSGDTIALDGDYQLVQTLAINEGKLAQTYDFLVLDNKLESVATLPKILKNQTEGIYFADDGKLIITTETADGDCVYYAADLKEGTVSLYADIFAVEYDDIFGDEIFTYQTVYGGFIYDGKLYNHSLEVLCDMSGFVSYRVIANGRSVLAEDKDGYFVCYIKDGVAEKNYISSSDDAYVYTPSENLIIVHNVGNSTETLYDLYGNNLATADEISLYSSTTDSIIIQCVDMEGDDFDYYVHQIDYYIIK